MQQTVETNPLFASRPDSAELRVAKAIEAYRDRDFDSLAGLIMADSNEMHALMLSTIPPLRYLTKTSFEIMDRIEQLNSEQGKRIAAYSFDAGPNAHIITLKQEQEKVALALQPLLTSGEIQYMKVSPVGGGPKILDGVSLITDELKEAHALTEPSGGLSE
jgi:diphosphomevalonate decarboxylase